jgi:hypothetical protein
MRANPTPQAVARAINVLFKGSVARAAGRER